MMKMSSRKINYVKAELDLLDALNVLSEKYKTTIAEEIRMLSAAIKLRAEMLSREDES